MKNFIIIVMLMVFGVVGCGPTYKGQVGAATGAAVGGAAGYFLTRNHLVGAAIGAGTGMLVGYFVGNELDKRDLYNISNALENTPTGMPMQWNNPDTGKSMTATPQAAYQYSNGATGRDVVLTTSDGERLYAKATRGTDGHWTLVQVQ